MRQASFAIWQPGRDPVRGPRTQDEQDFLDHEWREEGLRVLAPVQGPVQTVARAEDLALWAAICSDGAEGVASDSASRVASLPEAVHVGQGCQDHLEGRQPGCAQGHRAQGGDPGARRHRGRAGQGSHHGGAAGQRPS